MAFTPLTSSGSTTYRVGITHVPTQRGFDITFTRSSENTEAEIDAMIQEFIDYVAAHPNWFVEIGYKTQSYVGTFSPTSNERLVQSQCDRDIRGDTDAQPPRNAR